jgi:cell division protein FtsQ
MMAQHHYSFPVLTGIDPAEPLASRKQRVDLYMRLMSELDAGGQHFSNQISEIDLTDPEDARVEMQEQGADILAHFGEDHFLERYQRYKAHIAEWRAQYPRLTGVDLRYEQQVVLQMAQGPAPSAAQDAAANAGAPTVTSPTPAAQQPAQTAAVKHDAAPQQKPAAKPVSTKAPETKTAKPAETKAAKSVKGEARGKAKPHTAKDAAQQKRADRVRKIAQEQRKRAEARRVADKKAKPKSASKPQTPAANGQSE